MSKSLVQVLKDFCGVKYSYGAIKTVFSQSECGMFERRLRQLRADNLTLELLKAHDSQMPSIINPTPSTMGVIPDQMVILNQFIGR